MKRETVFLMILLPMLATAFLLSLSVGCASPAVQVGPADQPAAVVSPEAVHVEPGAVTVEPGAVQFGPADLGDGQPLVSTPVDVKAPVTATVTAPVEAPILSSPTEQHSASGDQSTDGNENVTVGGGNSIRLDGGTIVALAAVIVPCVIVGYLLSKGLLVIGRNTTQRMHRRRDAKRDTLT